MYLFKPQSGWLGYLCPMGGYNCALSGFVYLSGFPHCSGSSLLVKRLSLVTWRHCVLIFLSVVCMSIQWSMCPWWSLFHCFLFPSSECHSWFSCWPGPLDCLLLLRCLSPVGFVGSVGRLILSGALSLRSCCPWFCLNAIGLSGLSIFSLSDCLSSCPMITVSRFIVRSKPMFARFYRLDLLSSCSCCGFSICLACKLSCSFGGRLRGKLVSHMVNGCRSKTDQLPVKNRSIAGLKPD